jgi:diguanylate cyclase (GGDEF)-like protein/PAS domain S-box-containing protein
VRNRIRRDVQASPTRADVPRVDRRLKLAFLALSLVSCVAYVVLSVGRSGSTMAEAAYLGALGSAATAAAVTAIGRRRAGELRRHDAFVSVALVVWCTAEVGIALLAEAAASAWWPNLLVVAGTSLLFAGLAVRVSALGREFRTAILDSVAFGVAVAGFVWALLLRPSLAADPALADVITLLTPLVSPIAVSFAANVALRTKDRIDLVLVAACLAPLVADVAWANGEAVRGSLWATLWLVQFLGLALWVGCSTRTALDVPSAGVRLITVMGSVAIHLVARPFLSGDGRVDGLVTAVLDAVLVTIVAVRVRSVVRDAAAIQHERSTLDRMRALLRHSGDAIAVVDARGQVTFATEGWDAMTGGGVAIGATAVDHVHPDDRQAAAAAVERSLGREDVERAEVRLLPGRLDDDGCWLGDRWVEAIISDRRADPAIGGILLTARDVTDRRNEVERLAHLAARDELTGLLNRRSIESLITAELAALPDDRVLAVLFFDLDRFKLVNDTFGHESGDQLLVAVAEQLRLAAREGDHLARFGGDEFVVVCPGLRSIDDAVHVGERILDGLSTPVRVGGTVTSPSVTIGVSVRGGAVPIAADAVARLLAEADAAMYAGKQRGGHCVQVFSPRLRAQSADRLSIETDLRIAVERGEIAVAYQPLISAVDGRIAGVEALARWDRPGWGPVAPDAFIAIAEDSGMIHQLGMRVMERALADLLMLDNVAPGCIAGVAVNVSPLQLLDAHFVDDVTDLLVRFDADAERFTIEVTETTVVRDPDATYARLHRLREHGVQVAIDDFGVGHASLAALRSMPADVLKIDRSFVRDVLTDPVAQAIVDASVAIGRSAGMLVTAEGVETAEHLGAMRERGVHLLQGYQIARPMSFDALVPWLRALPASGVAQTVSGGEGLGAARS